MANSSIQSVKLPLEIIVPATSANIGPGFDALAIALNLHLKIEAHAAQEFSIAAVGRDHLLCAQVRDNLIFETYQEILDQQRRPVIPLALALENEIPIGKGCGSSAAARLAGVVLASHFGDLSWSEQRIFEETARREGHADNAAACWLGGLVVAQSGAQTTSTAANGIRAVQIAPSSPWQFLWIIPADRLSTKLARKALPNHYSSSDVVANIQNAVLLSAAFIQGRSDLLRRALSDRLHEPYRTALCPLLEPMRRVAVENEEVIGAVLSGAGPSVLLFLGPNADRSHIERKVDDALLQGRLSAELLFTEIGAGSTVRQLQPAATIHPGENS